MAKLTGSWPCVMAPFKENEDFDGEALKRQLDWLIEKGAPGILTTGSLGECGQLTWEERRELFDITVSHVTGRLPVMLGVCGVEQTTREAVEFSKYAQSIGADALMIKPPMTLGTFGRRGTGALEDYLRFFGPIRDAVSLPIMLYNSPGTTMTDATGPIASELARRDYIQYIKDGSKTMSRFIELIKMAGDRLTVFTGRDDLAFHSFVVGAKGGIMGCATILPEASQEVYELVEAGRIDEAMKLWYRMHELVEMCENGLGIAVLKYGLALRGVPAGRGRSPRPLLSDHEKLELKRLMDEFGLETLDISKVREF